MRLLRGNVTDDVDMNSFRLCIPDVETDGKRSLVSANALRNRNGIGTALLHRLRQLQEQPVIELSGEGMVEVHGFRLAPHMLGTDAAKGFIIGRTDAPERSLLHPIDLQPLAKDQQSIVALREGVAQIGAGTRSVVAVMHFTITEMNHEIVFVDDLESEDFSGICRYRRHQDGKQNDSLENLLYHINLQLLVSVVANKSGKDTDFLRESQTFYPLFLLQHNKTPKICVIISDETNEDISSAGGHATVEPDRMCR